MVHAVKTDGTWVCNFTFFPLLVVASSPRPWSTLHHPQQMRQQSSTDLEEMKQGVEELKEQITESDKAIAEITTSIGELEKKKSKVLYS